jgi:integrase
MADAATVTGPLWVSDSGRRLSYSAVGVVILETTRDRIGVPVNPHAFRMAAATTAAYQAPEEPHLGSALLHHTDSRVTEEHYTRVSSIKAVVRYGEIVRSLAD